MRDQWKLCLAQVEECKSDEIIERRLPQIDFLVRYFTIEQQELRDALRCDEDGDDGGDNHDE